MVVVLNPTPRVEEASSDSDRGVMSKTIAAAGGFLSKHECHSATATMSRDTPEISTRYSFQSLHGPRIRGRGKFHAILRAAVQENTQIEAFPPKNSWRFVPTQVRSNGDETSAVDWDFVTRHLETKVELSLQQCGFHLSRELALRGRFGLMTTGMKNRNLRPKNLQQSEPLESDRLVPWGGRLTSSLNFRGNLRSTNSVTVGNFMPETLPCKSPVCLSFDN